MILPKQPERMPADGEVSVQRLPEGGIALSSTTGGNTFAIVCSEYNAWRLFVMLSPMLGLPLSKAVGKVISL